MNIERQRFEDWYTVSAFDLKASPIGSRDCALQWAAWCAALLRRQPTQEAAETSQVQRASELEEWVLKHPADAAFELGNYRYELERLRLLAHPPKPEPTEAVASELETARAQLKEQHAVLMEAIKVTEGHWDSHGGQYHCDACNLHHKLLRLKENEHLLPSARPPVAAPKPPAEWMEAAAREIQQGFFDSNYSNAQRIAAIIAKHAPKVPEGFKLMPVPQEMTKTDIDDWRRNHELGKLLAAVKELK